MNEMQKPNDELIYGFYVSLSVLNKLQKMNCDILCLNWGN